MRILSSISAAALLGVSVFGLAALAPDSNSQAGPPSDPGAGAIPSAIPSPTPSEEGDGFALLAEKDGLRVYAPERGTDWGRLCPSAPKEFDGADLEEAVNALSLAVDELYRDVKTRPKFDFSDPEISVGIAGKHDGYVRRSCGPEILPKTAVGLVSFPHVEGSASLSYAIFSLSRSEKGWYLWAQVH